MKLRRFLSIPIFSVFVLVGFIYYITIFIFLEDWLGLQSSAGYLNTLIFTLLASFTLFSFLTCVFTDPGGVSSGFVPDIEHSDSSDQESKRSNVQLTQCEKCSAYKPPELIIAASAEGVFYEWVHRMKSGRATLLMVECTRYLCSRTTIRTDHHCLWINNCVGHRNYKAYVILVFYATMANIYSSVIIMCCALQKNWNFDGKIFLKTFYICCAVMVIGLSFTVGTLLGWHIYLITHNLTTIEYYEAIRAEWLAKKSGQSYRHPFDVGFYRNITLILGPNMVKWLFPTAVSHIKDGMHFPTARDSL